MEVKSMGNLRISRCSSRCQLRLTIHFRHLSDRRRSSSSSSRCIIHNDNNSSSSSLDNLFLPCHILPFSISLRRTSRLVRACIHNITRHHSILVTDSSTSKVTTTPTTTTRTIRTGTGGGSEFPRNTNDDCVCYDEMKSDVFPDDHRVLY